MPPRNRSRFNAIVSDWQFVTSNGSGSACYSLTTAEASALMSIADYLAWPTRWENAPDKDALEAFRDDIIASLQNPLPCDRLNCLHYPPLWPTLEYTSHRPDVNPTPPIQPSWTYNAETKTAYALSTLSIPTPEIYFPLKANTEANVHLVTVLLGGKVQIFDGGIIPLNTVSTNADITAIPPEIEGEIIIPVAAKDEDRTITIRFTASFDSELVPITFGGGFRGITICGETYFMPYRLRQNPTNACLLEQSLDEGGTWTTAFNYALCKQPASTTIYRYTETHVYQYSDDNGQTWTDMEQPPNSQPPTVTTPPAWDKWKAARNTAKTARAICQAWADAMIGAANPAALHDELLKSMETWWLPDDAKGAFAAGIGALGALLSAIDGAVLSLALADQAVWDDLACDCYCNMEDDFTYTAAQVTAIGEANASRHAFPLSTVIPNAVYLMGVTGMSNAARYNGDVSAYPATQAGCTCEWCYVFDFTASAAGWEQWLGQGATYSAGIGWQDITRTDTTKGLEIIRYFTASTITDIEVTIISDNITNGNVYIGADPGGWSATDTQTNGTHTYTHAGLALNGVTSVLINAAAQWATHITVTAITLKGTGENPFGGNNCP